MWFALRQQFLSDPGTLQRTIQCMLGPLTFTLNVTAVMTMLVCLTRKRLRPVVCAVVLTLVRQVSVPTLPVMSSLASLLIPPWSR